MKQDAGLMNRRSFIRATAATGAATALPGPLIRNVEVSPPVRIAIFGAGGQGWSNLRAVANQQIVALCDVDRNRCASARERFPDASFFADYRECLDQTASKIDAVIVSTPDHMHAPIALSAMRRGLHCYCEKPLAWAVPEARMLAETAKEHGLATQMGNGGTASSGFRKGVEYLRAGVLGPIRDIHVWTNRPVWPQAIDSPGARPSVPGHLDWDLWQGCAAERPYHPAYLPFKWRGWLDYGTGALGDMACHTMNLAVTGLELGPPSMVEAETTPRFRDSYPAGSRVTWHFPAVGENPPRTMTWYDGSMSPPRDLLAGRQMPGSGSCFIGERGTMLSAGDNCTSFEITPLPGDSVEGEGLPPELDPKNLCPWIPRSSGHHAEWLTACRGESDLPFPYEDDRYTMSHFGHAGPFSEIVLLGNLAVRIGGALTWDHDAMQATDRPDADAHLNRNYRDGFGV